MKRPPGAALALALALGLAACGRSEAPKVDAEAERKAATERARQGPMGDAVKALETAKGLEADVNRKALEAVEKAEKDAK